MVEKESDNITNQGQENNLVPAETEYRTLFKSGVEAYEKREFETAAKTFMEIYNKYPEQIEVLVNYADCQYELFNTEEALKYWNLAKEKDKYLINPYINLGNYYLNNERYEEAIKEYTFAFCLNPHNESSLVNLAITYENISDRKKAFMLYEFFLDGNLNVSSTTYKNIHKKVAKHKLNAISQMKLGIYFERKGYWRKAIQAYFDSMRVFPNFAKTYSNIGNIFFKLEKYEYAKMYWIEAYKMDKRNPNLILNLALCSEKTKDYIDAYAFYSKFINRVKSNVQELHLAEEALQKNHIMIQKTPENSADYKQKAEEYFNNEQWEDALICYENLATLYTKNDIADKINKLQVETNLIHKASYVSFQMAQELFEKGNFEFAIDKCKISASLWKNSFFEQNVRNLLLKCQTILGNSINNKLITKN